MEDLKAKQARASALVKEKKAASDADRDARTNAAETAIVDAIIGAGGDTSRLIVHRLPDTFGGAVVYRLPGEGYWASYTKRLVASEKKNNLPEVIAGLVENKDLLIHPEVSDLQKWVESYPGLYTSIANTISARCEGTDPGKGSLL